MPVSSDLIKACQNDTEVELPEKTQEKPGANRRVLLLISSLQLGGAERQIVDISNYLSRTGIDVHLGILRGGVSEFYDLEKEINVLPGLISGGRTKIERMLSKLSAIVRLRSYLVKHEIGHIVSALDEASVVGSILSHSRPRVVTFVALQVYILGNIKRTKNAWERFLMRSALRRADKVISVSSLVERSLIKEIGLKKEKISTIGNFVSLQAISDRRNELPIFDLPDGPFLIFVGRLSPDKRIDLLIRAVGQLVKEFPDLKLLIIGEGGMRRELEGLVKHLSLGDVVSMPGATDNPYPYIQAARALVLCSEAEGFGNVILEALACGTPCVCTGNIGAGVDLLTGSRFGMVVEKDGLTALVGGIRTCITEIPKSFSGDEVLQFDEHHVMPRLMQVIFEPCMA